MSLELSLPRNLPPTLEEATVSFETEKGNDDARVSGMDVDSIGEIIATRMLYFVDQDGKKRPVSVFIGKPQPSQNSSGYHCPFQVIGVGSQKTHLAGGLDSIQALQSALVLIAAKLNHFNAELGGKLSWDGVKGELGFP